MKAIILAAGTGSRLRPLTNERPKCLVSLKGLPLLEYQLAVIRACGIEDIVIVSGYKHTALSTYGLREYRNSRFESTNMVHSLFCAEKEFGEDLIVLYSDIVYEQRVLEALIANRSDFAVVVDRGWRSLWELRMDDPLADAESLKVDAQGRITDIGRKVSAYSDIEAQYIGLLKFSANQLSKLCALYNSLDRKAVYDGKDFDNMFMTTLVRLMIEQGMAPNAVFIEHGWLEVDSLFDLEKYESLLEVTPLFNFAAFRSGVAQ